MVYGTELRIIHSNIKYLTKFDRPSTDEWKIYSWKLKDKNRKIIKILIMSLIILISYHLITLHRFMGIYDFFRYSYGTHILSVTHHPWILLEPIDNRTSVILVCILDQIGIQFNPFKHQLEGMVIRGRSMTITDRFLLQSLIGFDSIF